MDRISILRHPTNLLAKRWRADGSIEPYGDAKYFQLIERDVDGPAKLFRLLDDMLAMPRTCVIRGRYVGDVDAQRLDPEYEAGKVRRINDLFADQPLHWVMIDIDQFEPTFADPVHEPESAVREYIETCLPAAFHKAACRWHLSNSAGRKKWVLKAHLWFWLAEPLTGAQLTAWARETGLAGVKGKKDVIDIALFRQVQVHYTANPVFDPGVEDPVPVRAGRIEGGLVDLVLSDGARAAQTVGASRLVRLTALQEADPIAQRLAELGMVKSSRQDGGLNIACPFESGHSTEGSESSTIYYLPHTGGYDRPSVKCLHTSCQHRPQHEFLREIGYDPAVLMARAEDFADLPSAPNLPSATVREGPGVEQEEMEQALKNALPPSQYACTDQRNARRIIQNFGGTILSAEGRWYGWTGRRWLASETIPTRAATQLSTIIRREAETAASKARAIALDDEAKAAERKQHVLKAEALHKWAQQSEMTARISAALSLTKKLLEMDAEKLDADPLLLNCKNGVVDLRTGQLLPHHAAFFLTKLVPVDYIADAPEPKMWLDTLHKAMGEKPGDAPKVAFLKRWFGYCLTGRVNEQVMVIHYGEGSNAKSLILETVSAIMGDYAGSAAPGLATSRGDRHPTEIADLRGRRLVTASESSEGADLREDFIKQATGGDRMKARHMREDFFEFMPTHKLQLLTNHKPAVKGNDHGIWRRLLLVPYGYRFGTREEVEKGRAHYVKDLDMLVKLRPELPGILKWLVEGAREWSQVGLLPPDEVRNASLEYRHEQDRVGQFIAERCIIEPDAEVVLSGGMAALYPAYVSWCREVNIHPYQRQKFVNVVRSALGPACQLVTRTTKEGDNLVNVSVLTGLRLQPEIA